MYLSLMNAGSLEPLQAAKTNTSWHKKKKLVKILVKGRQTWTSSSFSHMLQKDMVMPIHQIHRFTTSSHPFHAFIIHFPRCPNILQDTLFLLQETPSF